jgi:hypothetical protein
VCAGGLQAKTVTIGAHATGSSSIGHTKSSGAKTRHLGQSRNKTRALGYVRNRVLPCNEFYTTCWRGMSAGARMPTQAAPFRTVTASKLPPFWYILKPCTCATPWHSPIHGAHSLLKRRNPHHTCVLESCLACQHVPMTAGHDPSWQVPRINFCRGMNRAEPVRHPWTFGSRCRASGYHARL